MRSKPLVLTMIVVLLLAALPAATAARPDAPDALDKIEPLVLQEIDAAGRTDFFLWLTEKADLSPAEKLPTKLEKGRFVYETLRATAERTQKDLRAALDRQGARYEAFYIANKILVYGGDQALLLQLAARPDVARVTANHRFHLEEPFHQAPAPDGADVVEPNITFVKAPQVWAMGYTGQGTVLAGNDTGLDETHPALRAHYRGCLNPPACTVWDHNYNWWDATGTYPVDPGDGHMHGTYTTGIMVGDDGGVNQIGVAPGSQTIHCKHCTDSGECWDLTSTRCFQWDLAPWDLAGQNPRPDLAPDAVNNSWGYSGYYPSFEDEVAALQAAGILVEASAGNDGPACGTVLSPGAYAPVLTTGSVNHTAPHPGLLTWFSSRGPSAGYPDAYFPDVMAPGQNIRSSYPGGGYVYESGTSASGPHATGLVDLLWSACPALRGQVALTQELIQYTAVPLTGQGGNNCGGDYINGPNNDWGYGTIDALAAVQEALARCGALAHLDGHVYDLATAQPIAAAQVSAARDAGGRWTLETNTDGYYSFTTPAGAFTVTAAAFGYYPATVAGVGVISGAVTTQDFSLAALPAYLVSGTVVEAGSGAPLSATVAVVGSPYPPAQTDPGTGFYALSVPSGTRTLRVESWGYYRQEREIVADHDQTQGFGLAPMPFVPDRHNPLLEPGPPGAWDSAMAAAPDVLQAGGLTYLFYVGWPHPAAIG